MIILLKTVWQRFSIIFTANVKLRSEQTAISQLFLSWIKQSIENVPCKGCHTKIKCMGKFKQVLYNFEFLP